MFTPPTVYFYLLIFILHLRVHKSSPSSYDIHSLLGLFITCNHFRYLILAPFHSLLNLCTYRTVFLLSNNDTYINRLTTILPSPVSIPLIHNSIRSLFLANHNSPTTPFLQSFQYLKVTFFVFRWSGCWRMVCLGRDISTSLETNSAIPSGWTSPGNLASPNVWTSPGNSAIPSGWTSPGEFGEPEWLDFPC